MHLNFYHTHQLASRLGRLNIRLTRALDMTLAESQHQDTLQKCALLSTDQQGSALGRLEHSTLLPVCYSAYGHHSSYRHDLVAFCGYSKDAKSASYLLGQGYRAYSPTLMRFGSADTLSPFGQGGINAYAYCLNDPINNVDHSGHAGSKLSFTFPRAKSRLSSPDDVMVDRIIARQQRAHEITKVRFETNLAYKRERINQLKAVISNTSASSQTPPKTTQSTTTPNFQDLLSQARQNPATFATHATPSGSGNKPTFLELLQRAKEPSPMPQIRDPNTTQKPN